MITKLTDLPDYDVDNISVCEEEGTRRAFPKRVNVQWQVRAARSLGQIVHFAVRRRSRGAWIIGSGIPKHVRQYLCANSDGKLRLGNEDFPDWAEFCSAVAKSNDCKLQKVRGWEEGLALRFLATIEEEKRVTPVPGVRVSISFSEPLEDGTSEFLPYPFSRKKFLETVQNLKDAEADLRAENGILDDAVCPGCGEQGMEKEWGDDGSYSCMNGCGETFTSESVMKQFGE